MTFEFLTDKDFGDKCGSAFVLLLGGCVAILAICGTIYFVGLLLGVDAATERRGAEYALVDLREEVTRIRVEVSATGVDPISANRVDEVISRKLAELRAK
jgi:hypothetical protein